MKTYIATEIRIYVTEVYLPDWRKNFESEKFVAVENGKILANASDIRKLSEKLGVRAAGLAKDENGIVYRTTKKIVVSE